MHIFAWFSKEGKRDCHMGWWRIEPWSALSFLNQSFPLRQENLFTYAFIDFFLAASKCWVLNVEMFEKEQKKNNWLKIFRSSWNIFKAFYKNWLVRLHNILMVTYLVIFHHFLFGQFFAKISREFKTSFVFFQNTRAKIS